MKRRTALGLATAVLWLTFAAPVLAEKPDKGDRNADGKPGWGPPIHAPANGVRRATGECHWGGCPNPTPPEHPRPSPPEPRPDPEPPPVIVLPDTAI